MVRLTSLFIGSVGLLLAATTATQVAVLRSSYDTIESQEYEKNGELLTQRFRDQISGSLRSLRTRIDQAASMTVSADQPNELADTARRALSSTISSDLISNPTALFIVDHDGRLRINLSAKQLHTDSEVIQMSQSFKLGSQWSIHFKGMGKGDNVIILYRKAVRGSNGQQLAWICGGLQLDGSIGLLNFIRDSMDLRVAGLIFKDREPLLVADDSDEALLTSLRVVIQENRIKRHVPAFIEAGQPLFWRDTLPVNPILTELSMVFDMPSGVTASIISIQRASTVLSLLATAAFMLVGGFALQWLFRVSVMRTLAAAESAASGSPASHSKRNIIREFNQVEHSFKTLARKLRVESEERHRAQGVAQHQAIIAEQQVEQLRLLNGQLEQFTFSASHDLKSPLLTIGGLANAANTAMKENDYSVLAYSVKRIEMQSEQLVNRIVQILEILRSDHVDTTWETVHLQSLVNEIWRNAIDTGEEQLQLQCFPDPLPDVPASFDLLRGVLENMLNNSIKYRDPEKLQCLVIIRVTQDLEGVQLQVEDNGVGIDEVFHEDLFQMFKRFSSLDVPGYGLGLALVKRYLLKMNGSISYKLLPCGSRFSIEWKPPKYSSKTSLELVDHSEFRLM